MDCSFPGVILPWASHLLYASVALSPMGASDPSDSAVKNPPANIGDLGLTPG